MRHEPNTWAFRPQKLVEASSNSTKIAQNVEAFDSCGKTTHGTFICTRAHTKKHSALERFPVFKVFFFDFRTLAVSRSSGYASAQRAAHCGSRTACGIETSKARVPRYETSKSARTVIPTNFYADEQIRGEPQIENWKMNYDARVWVRPRTTTRGGTDTLLHRQGIAATAVQVHHTTSLLATLKNFVPGVHQLHPIYKTLSGPGQSKYCWDIICRLLCREWVKEDFLALTLIGHLMCEPTKQRNVFFCFATKMFSHFQAALSCTFILRL